VSNACWLALSPAWLVGCWGAACWPAAGISANAAKATPTAAQALRIGKRRLGTSALKDQRLCVGVILRSLVCQDENGAFECGVRTATPIQRVRAGSLSVGRQVPATLEKLFHVEQLCHAERVQIAGYPSKCSSRQKCFTWNKSANCSTWNNLKNVLRTVRVRSNDIPIQRAPDCFIRRDRASRISS